MERPVDRQIYGLRFIRRHVGDAVGDAAIDTAIDTEQLVFRALADPTRRTILHLLAKSDLTIAEVAAHFQMTRAAVKKHLAILTQGHLVTVRASGRSKINALNGDGMKRAADWLGFFDTYWDQRLAALKTEIEKDIT